jgi:predicted nucleic acid-binding protein
VLVHPYIVGEIALGNIKNRTLVLLSLSELPCTKVAQDVEVLSLIERHSLFGAGLGYVDCHLLASALLSGTDFWTKDKRLASIAGNLGLIGEFG